MKISTVFVFICLRLLLQSGSCFARCSSSNRECPGNANICIPNIHWCDTVDDCPGGADEENCPTDCSGANQFQCDDGECIPKSQQCDHEHDCGDSSDETNCNTTVTCRSDQFACGMTASRSCISIRWVCDGDNDCGDRSDESRKKCGGKTCNQFQFQCNDKSQCKPASYRCDGGYDCDDHSDENGCNCTDSQFDCNNGRCISKRYKCDGGNDCGNMEDEKKENCPSIHPGACHDKLPYLDCLRMNVTTYPICNQYSDAFEYCRKYCNLCEN